MTEPTQDEIEELNAYVKGIRGGYVIQENMGYCGKCGEWEDLRFGICFECVFDRCPLPLGECEFLHFGYWKHKIVVYNDQYVGLKGEIYCNSELCDRAKEVMVGCNC
jgi:hypothetical protein